MQTHHQEDVRGEAAVGLLLIDSGQAQPQCDGAGVPGVAVHQQNSRGDAESIEPLAGDTAGRKRILVSSKMRRAYPATAGTGDYHRRKGKPFDQEVDAQQAVHPCP